jgi:hypothetical protein
MFDVAESRTLKEKPKLNKKRRECGAGLGEEHSLRV